MNILVTGAGGFFGKHLVSYLNRTEHTVIPVYRSLVADVKNSLAIDINPNTDWTEYLKGIDIVIHLAAKAHIMNKKERINFDYETINHFSTANLASYVKASNVKKFIFVSTVKVSGESSKPNISLKTSYVNSNLDPYSQSKLNAENSIKEIFTHSNTDLIIIRPPLIYGAGVKGNFKLLIKLIESRLPIPLNSIKNKRSIVSTYNFIDFIMHCISYDKKINDTFFVSDGEYISTPHLIKLIAESLNKKVWLFNFNKKILSFIAKIFKKDDHFRRLSGDLIIDIEKNNNLLGWTPKLTISKSINKMFSVELE